MYLLWIIVLGKWVFAFFLMVAVARATHAGYDGSHAAPWEAALLLVAVAGTELCQHWVARR